MDLLVNIGSVSVELGASTGRLLGCAFLPQEWEVTHQLLGHEVALA